MPGFSTSRVHPLQLFAVVALLATCLVTSDSYGCPPQQLQQQFNSGCYQQQAIVQPYVQPQQILIQRQVQRYIAPQQIVVQQVQQHHVEQVRVLQQRQPRGLSVQRQRIVTRTR